jgi:hypothetical protein
MTRTEKIAFNKAKKLINKTYTENCCGIQIDIMDISKVFAAGHAALKEGRDLKTAIVAFVETIRKN